MIAPSVNLADEPARLQELIDYGILDTLPESEFDDIVELASAICQTPISLITLIDSDRQWFKAKVGIDVSETPRETSFCAHGLYNPDDILVVPDATKDERFFDNPLVTGNPNIRFYAGAPLTTPKGNVLGSLCIIDNKKKKLTPTQQRALKILSEKVIERLEHRKLKLQLLEHEQTQKDFLEKLTYQTPVIIYVMEVDPEGKIHFPFISRSLSTLYPTLTPEMLGQDGSVLFRLIHPDDYADFMTSALNSRASLGEWEFTYRIRMEDDSIRWHWTKARPEKKADGTLVYYGATMDVTESQEYVQTIEEILFDISHVMRRPVSTMLGLVALMRGEMTQDEIKMYAGHFKTVAEEMDAHITRLNDTYYQKKLHVERSKR